MLRLQPQESWRGTDRHAPRRRCRCPDLLRQQRVGEAELQLPQRLGVGDLLERLVRQHREIGRHIDEGPRADVDPDAEHALLAALDDGLPRAGHGHDDVVAGGAAARRRGVGLDRAEQHDRGAGKVRVHQHLVARDRRHQPLGRGGRGARDATAEQRSSGDGEVPRHSAPSSRIE